MLRRYLVSISKGISTLLSQTPGSTRAYITQILVAFFISGMIHSFGDAMASRTFVGTSMAFFMLQPVAIALETIFQQCTSHILRDWATFRRLFGYLWVIMWFSAFTPGIIRWCLALGLNEIDVLPFSVVEIIVRYIR